MTREVWDDVVGAGRRIALPEPALAALPEIVRRIADAPPLADTFTRLAEALRQREPSEAIASVKAARLEEALRPNEARAVYLALALSQVEAAERRHAGAGVDPSISVATLADLGVWVRHFGAQLGIVGITAEILDWSQRYLRGELYRIGQLQFDLRSYTGPLRVYRHTTTRALAVRWVEDGAPERAVDPATGEVNDAPVPPLPAATWQLALAPGAATFDMHIPAGARLGVAEFARALEGAYAFFRVRSPELVPVGACGEAWLLDPQMVELLPGNEGLHALRRACCLYPSALTEDKTIRRLFGPDVDRAQLAHLPDEGMTSLHRALRAFLADPSRRLTARGGLILREELDVILARLPPP